MNNIIRTFSSQNCEKDDGDTGGISVHNIGGVFVIIIVGVIISMISLVAEYNFYRCKRTNWGRFLARKVGDFSILKVVGYDKKTNKW